MRALKQKGMIVEMEITTKNCKLIDWTDREKPIPPKYKVYMNLEVELGGPNNEVEELELSSVGTYSYDQAEKIRDKITENTERRNG